MQFEIKDRSGLSCILMNPIAYYGDICQFKYHVQLNCKGFTAFATVHNELADWEMLNRALSMMMEDNFSYEYKPMIDENLCIVFTRTPTGIINVKCRLNNEDHTCEMQINFDIDQTFLTDICNQIENIIEYFHQNKR